MEHLLLAHRRCHWSTFYVLSFELQKICQLKVELRHSWPHSIPAIDHSRSIRISPPFPRHLASSTGGFLRRAYELGLLPTPGRFCLRSFFATDAAPPQAIPEYPRRGWFWVFLPTWFAMRSWVIVIRNLSLSGLIKSIPSVYSPCSCGLHNDYPDLIPLVILFIAVQLHLVSNLPFFFPFPTLLLYA